MHHAWFCMVHLRIMTEIAVNNPRTCTSKHLRNDIVYLRAVAISLNIASLPLSSQICTTHIQKRLMLGCTTIDNKPTFWWQTYPEHLRKSYCDLVRSVALRLYTVRTHDFYIESACITLFGIGCFQCAFTSLWVASVGIHIASESVNGSRESIVCWLPTLWMKNYRLKGPISRIVSLRCQIRYVKGQTKCSTFGGHRI